MRVFKQVNVNLSLSHVEQSGDNRANGARLSDLIAKSNRPATENVASIALSA
jgi:hypothetical protein